MQVRSGWIVHHMVHGSVPECGGPHLGEREGRSVILSLGVRLCRAPRTTHRGFS